MPREIYNLTPISEVTLAQINRLIVELNTVLGNLSEQLAKLEGRNGHTSQFYGDVDMQGKRLKNAGRSVSKVDVPNVEELIEKALYAIGNRHVADMPIEANAGIVTPRAESGDQAIPLAQLLEQIDISIADLVTGPASATDNAVARFDATTGKIIQNSGVIIDDADNMLVPGEITVSTIVTDSGDFEVTPAAGGGFVISLSGVGDFIVNTNDLVVDTSAGRVGIGTASPATELEVVGRVRSTQALDSAFFQLVTSDGTPYTWTLYIIAGDIFVIRDTTAGADRFTISTSGVVTIPSLAGVGSRNVVADANGALSAP